MLQLSAKDLKRPYEAIIIMDPETPEAEQKALFKKNEGIIGQFKGEVNHIDTWGKRKLANPIGKIRRGIYFHSTFTADPEAIAELERTMKINEKVLRCVHTRLPDTTNLTQYVENFKAQLAETLRKEKEKQEKYKARKAKRAAGPA